MYDGHRVSATGKVEIEKPYLSSLYKKHDIKNPKFVRTHAVSLGQKQVHCPSHNPSRPKSTSRHQVSLLMDIHFATRSSQVTLPVWHLLNLQTVLATQSATWNLNGYSILNLVCLTCALCIRHNVSDIEQVPSPNLPYSADVTDLGLYRNSDLFLFAKKKILPGDWFTWHYLMCDAKTPVKLPPPLPHLMSPPKKKRNREDKSRSVSPISPMISPVKKLGTWTPKFSKNIRETLATAIAKAKNTESSRLAKAAHKCPHHTTCPAGKCSECKCASCATNQVSAGSKRPAKPSLRLYN
jgi:hypothetical protein